MAGKAQPLETASEATLPVLLILALPLTSCVTLGYLFHHSGLSFLTRKQLKLLLKHNTRLNELINESL